MKFSAILSYLRIKENRRWMIDKISLLEYLKISCRNILNLNIQNFRLNN
jgi:hypothetical protein